MRLLLDEHISPSLVDKLAEVGVYAQSVPHVGYLVERIMRYGGMLSITILQLLRRMRETSSNSSTWTCIQG
jgi:hypothetical protein